MSEEFKPIETQEALNNIIKDRLQRERETTQKRFEGWVSPEDHQKALADANKALEDIKKARESDEKTIADLSAKVKAYETDSLKSRIAREVGLSSDWASRISGEDEESIKADAEALKKLVGSSKPQLPTKNPESGEHSSSEDKALRGLLNGLTKK